MKKIIKSDFLLTPYEIIENKAICFEKKIIKIDSFENLKKLFPKAKIYEFKNSIVLPAFTNIHTHLEFSANRGILKYGNFIDWLYSIIKNRDFLVKACKKRCYKNVLTDIKKSGIATIGAISNNLKELPYLLKAPFRVVFFLEIIGSNPNAIQPVWDDFLEKYKKIKRLKSEKFIPAIAIHSPYSVHRDLIKKTVSLAKRDNLLISVHFMESFAEREWIDKGSGEFKKFFKEFLNQDFPANNADGFLEELEDYPCFYAHCVWNNEEELKRIRKNGIVVHCPTSNRILGNGVLNLKKLTEKNIDFILATDGLSSNYSLNIYEEMRNALFLHSQQNLLELAKKLIISATHSPQKIAGLNSGEIKEGKIADLQVIKLCAKNKEQVYLNAILYTKEIQKLFIEGEEV
jgi:cytosine/adenosine deaminase-related metal-dependent hydrolase